MPACWTGVYGLKATHGLVPYTGVMPIEPTLDHCGPMAATVEDVARLLTAIAGPDGRDPRQIDCETQDYMAALRQDVKGMKIAVVKEGFDRPESQAAVDRKVKNALQRLKSLGVTVEEVSIPMHVAGYDIWNAIIIEGAAEVMIKGNGLGYGWEGTYTTSLLDAYAPRLALAAERHGGDREDRPVHGRIHAPLLPRALLRQSAESEMVIAPGV